MRSSNILKSSKSSTLARSFTLIDPIPRAGEPIMSGLSPPRNEKIPGGGQILSPPRNLTKSKKKLSQGARRLPKLAVHLRRVLRKCIACFGGPRVPRLNFFFDLVRFRGGDKIFQSLSPPPEFRNFFKISQYDGSPAPKMESPHRFKHKKEARPPQAQN